MVSIIAEREGGAERTTRERDQEERTKTGGSAVTGFFSCEGDAADVELATLMPALKRQFEAVDEDEGSLNFMGEINMANNEESFRHSADKENDASGRNSLRRSIFRDRNSVRQGNGRVTTKRPIDYNMLLAMNKTLLSPLSGSLCLARNKSMALKENVNKAALQSQIVDDFWETEMEKKTSAVARRKLAGIRTPAQTKPQVVEDRHVRHARSRRADGHNRKLSKQPIKLDLQFHAAKISEWEQESLAEEEVAPSTRGHTGTFISTGRRLILQANPSDFDRGRKEVGVEGNALGEGGREDETRSQEDFLQHGVEPNRPNDVLMKMDSPSSQPDMDWSAGESPAVGVQDFSGKGEHGQNPLQDQGCASPNLVVEKSFRGHPTRIMPWDPVTVEVIEESSSRSPGRSRSLREDAGGNEEIQQDPRPRDSNLENDASLTPCRGFPVLETSNLQQQRIPVTSPTPPSNPVAVYMSLRHLEGDVRQRRLDFISSPSTATSSTSEAGVKQNLKLNSEQKTDFWEVESAKELCRGMDQFMSSSKGVQTFTRHDSVDEDLDLPDVNESQPIAFEKSGTSLAQQPEPTLLVHNKGESVDDVAVPFFDNSVDGVPVAEAQNLAEAMNQSGNREEALPLVDTQDDSGPAEGVIWTDEGSTTEVPATEAQNFAKEMDETGDRADALPRVDTKDDCGPAEGVIWTDEGSTTEVPAAEAQIFAEEMDETGDRAETLPRIDIQDDCAPAEGVIWREEGSTTGTQPKITKKRIRKAKEKRRFSLEESGTIWKDGHRRSQRIRVRPLEWWRGEKLLYGRINKSLLTVIGIKHSSPGKYAAGIAEPFVVESYVPDEYSELVRFAAI